MKAAFFIFLLGTFTLLGQGNSLDNNKWNELGIPYIQNYDPKEYAARPDNQSIVQAGNGVMYFGNSAGVLEFDGVAWRLITLPNQGLAKTLVKDNDNRIYAAGFNELGYLEPDSLGRNRFRSIKSLLDPANREFGYIQNSFTVDNSVYFQTENNIIRWQEGVFKVLPSTNKILYSGAVNSTIYQQVKDVGLQVLVKDQWEHLLPIPYELEELLPFDRNSLLVATDHNGLFLLRDKALIPFDSPANPYFKQNRILQARLLPNGWISIGTGYGGLVILDRKGSVVFKIGKSEGLLSDSILAQALDDNGGIWLGLIHGISRVEALAPYTIFDDRLGVNGFVNAITRFQGDLLAAGIFGLIKLEKGRGVNGSYFQSIGGLEPAFYFEEVADRLFIASRKGVFAYSENEVSKISDHAAGSLLHSKKDPSLLFVGLVDGFAVLKRENGHWKDQGKIMGIQDDIREIIELDTGVLWLESQTDGVWKLDFYPEGKLDLTKPKITRFLSNQQLPPGVLFLHAIRGKPIFEIGGQIYTYDSNLDSIIPHTAFGDLFGFQGLMTPKYEDKHGNVWISAQLDENTPDIKQRTVCVLQPDGGYEVKPIIDNRITHQVRKALYPEDSGILWYGGVDGIIRQDLNKGLDPIPDFRALVRRIAVNGDSLLFGGNLDSSSNTIWKFANNTIRFDFAIGSYNEPGANQYQYFLEGYDDYWSDWSSETKKDYTKIPEGDYMFRVRARNIYGQVSGEGTYSFAILPPWYRSWWAYMLYLLLFLLLLRVLIQWRSRQLIARNEELERVVAMRTAEVQHQANQLRVQAEKLQELDKAKSRFFANISHEFRTPLTLIKGPIEHLEEHSDERLGLDTVKMIRRNANRLLQMVNQLLDLSKIDEGSLKLSPTEGDVFKCLRAATSSFNSHAAQRNIDYRVQIPPGALWASFDRDKLENVIYNLLGNAFKFSKDGAKISFLASFVNSSLQLLVTDTGKGIPEEDLPFIFDRFYQVDGSTIRDKEGSGIGLSLSRDLVELMGGSIRVNSEVGKGTIFRLQLPLEEIKTKSPKEVKAPVPNPTTAPKRAFALTKPDKRDLPRILLVEDNADMRQFIKDQLLPHYRVSEAVNGELGLKMAMKLPPDLLITDLMMPRMDGIELCRKLKTHLHTSHVPVIMLTAKAGRDNKIEGLETGADDYLTKPFDGKELLARIKNLIDQRRQLRELYHLKEHRIDPSEITVTSLDQRFLAQLLELLEEEHSDPDFGVPQMQKALAMSKTQLHRKLKALTNEAPGELLRNFRLKRAAQLLRQKEDSVTQIAYKVGFNNLSYFAKCFKGLFGKSPSAY